MATINKEPDGHDLSGGDQIRLRKVFAFEQKWFPSRLGKGE
jgi:hypothetical protein